MKTSRQQVVICDNGTGVCVMMQYAARSGLLASACADHLPLQFVKCGFAGDNFPRASFPCMVGRPMLRSEEGFSECQLKVGGLCWASCIHDICVTCQNLLMQDIVVGQQCSQHRHSLEVSYPITNGIVQKWDDMQHVWNHTFYEQLQIDPTECKILLTDPPLNPKENRDRLLQTMFEHYGFAAAFIQIQAVLTLYAQGESTTVDACKAY